MTDQPVRLHRELADLHAYVVPITPKILREALCVAQTGIGSLPASEIRRLTPEHLARHQANLQLLIDEIDQMRPTGPDGSHDGRHTQVCGCTDARSREALDRRSDVPVSGGIEDLQRWERHIPGTDVALEHLVVAVGDGDGTARVQVSVLAQLLLDAGWERTA